MGKWAHRFNMSGLNNSNAQLYDPSINDNGSPALLTKVIGIADWEVDDKLNTYNYTMWDLDVK
jgi:hypothetical protein